MNEYCITLKITTSNGTIVETVRYRLAETPDEAKESALKGVKQMWNDRPVVVTGCKKMRKS